MKPYRCVIFDLDGTVVDSHAYTFAAFRHACAPYRSPPTDAEVQAAFGPDERVILRGMVGASRVLEAYARLQSYYADHVHDLVVGAEIRRLLDDCGAHGVRRGLFTGRGSDSTRLLLNALDLNARFDAVTSGDEARPKPAPDGVRVLLAVLGCAAVETLLVGDSSLDLAAASAAGTDAALALWYLCTPAPHATLRLHRPDDLRPLLGLSAAGSP